MLELCLASYLLMSRFSQRNIKGDDDSHGSDIDKGDMMMMVMVGIMVVAAAAPTAVSPVIVK